MKKLMTIGLAAVLMFAVAAQVQAAHAPQETNIELRERFFYLDSYKGMVAEPSNGKSDEFWDQRLRILMKWQVADAVKLELRTDIGEGLWGHNNKLVTTTTVTEDPVTGVHTVTGTTTGVEPRGSLIHFDRVNMQFTWPGTPLTFIIGRQDASWGVGTLGKDDNRDRLKVVGAFDFGTLVLVYQKAYEVFTAHDTGSRDDDEHIDLVYVGKAAGWEFGVLGEYSLGLSDGTKDTKNIVASVFAMGKAGPVNLAFEADYLTGTTDYAAAGKADVDNQGMQAYLGASMPAGPVTIGVEVGYSAGNDISTAGKDEGALKFDAHSPFDSVVLFCGKTDIPGYAGESTAGGSSLSNAMAGKLTVTAKPTAALTIVGAVLYAQRLEDTATAKADPLGTEIDLVMAYAITPNVTWKVGAGYLITGDFYGDADNALAMYNNFTLKF